MSAPSESIDLYKILSESKRIIKSQVHHFQALLLIFLLPFSFSLVIYPILHTIIFKFQPDSPLTIAILINLLYILFDCVLSICSVASISYSAFNAFYGTPVDLITSIKSIFHSFFPLVFTLIIQELIIALIALPIVYQAVHIYGSESFYNSSNSYVVCIIIMTLSFLLIMTYLRVNWILVSVIVVVESKWGLEPLLRSSQLVKGKRGVAFSMILLFALVPGAFFWGFYAHSSWNWGFVCYIISSSLFLAINILHTLVANVVLYVYCMEMNGEVLPYSNVKEFPLLK